MKHIFQNAHSDGADSSIVRPSNWNAKHVYGRTPISSDTTLDDTHDLVEATGGSVGITVTLPTAVGRAGYSYKIVRADSNTGPVTIATTSAQTINGQSNYTL